jgi:hypothetical protein
MRRLRRTIESGLPFLATMIAMFAIADPMGFSPSVRIFVGVAGLLLLQASVWRLANPLLPDDRHFMALRGEGDHFIDLLRQLHRVAMGADAAGRPVVGDPEVEAVREEMHATVDRMVKVAAQREE